MLARESEGLWLVSWSAVTLGFPSDSKSEQMWVEMSHSSDSMSDELLVTKLVEMWGCWLVGVWEWRSEVELEVELA